MRRLELEHVIRAASGITRHEEFVIIGSQAILGEHPEAPMDLLGSMEVDLYPRHNPEDSTLIDGAIGEGSAFHDTFGYYAHGVGPETATLPQGWEDRLVAVKNQNTRGATGWCLETHDLAVSKLIAGRPRDLEYVRDLLRYRLANFLVVETRLHSTSLEEAGRDLAVARLRTLRGP